MGILSGVDFYRGQLENGATASTGIADMAGAGVDFMIAKVGQAYYIDSAWGTHKTRLLALGTRIVRGAYWFLERDPSDDPGWFYPPVRADWRYMTSTHGPLSGLANSSHGAYEVDFNRINSSGTPIEDEGDPVRAIQKGTVTARNTADGSIYISHPGGYRSRYVHMKDILVSVGDAVTLGQRIGSISNVSVLTDNFGPHLHHLHEKRSGPGEPYQRIKMRFQGEALTASIAHPEDLPSDTRKVGQPVTGRDTPTRYTGTSQADRFLGAIADDHDPTGWLCALDVETSPGNTGVTAKWQQVQQFIAEFHRQAPGYPLFLYARKTFWNAAMKTSTGAIADAEAAGFAGLWTADYTQGYGGIFQSNFASAIVGISFSRTAETPYAGDYAGFGDSTIVQFGSLKVQANGSLRTVDGNAFDGTLSELRTLATSGGTGPPTDTTVPDLVGDPEESALADLATVGLIAGTRTTATSATVPVDCVISTTPVAGTEVALGSAVAYVVSLGPPAVPSGFDPSPDSPCG